MQRTARRAGGGLSGSEELRNNGVVKYVGEARETPAGAPQEELATGERSTRNRVARSILDHGPSTVADLAGRLGLTQAAVRRHLDALVADDVVQPREQRVYGARTRGRPAKVFALTDCGRDAFDQSYDKLAEDALRWIAEREGGDEAVLAFARARIAAQADAYREAVEAAPPEERTEALARALSADGYAAAARSAPVGGAALPAPLPGRPRRRAVPAAVRGGDGVLLPAARHARPAAGHHRPRRRCVHDVHPQDFPHRSPRICKHGREEPRMTLPTETAHPELEGLGKYEYGWADSDTAGASAKRGINEDVVRDISAKKNEPEWMPKLRLKGLRLFEKKPMPNWGSDLSGIDFDNIKYFVRSTEKQAESWEDLPEDIKNTYDKLGIPEAEKQRLVAGVAAQYESEVVYHQIREDLEEQGVIFLDTDTALREHPELFKEYFGTVIPVGDNKFASLNTAVWSGGSFIYVPKGVHVEIPLQAYFRINTENMGQFERTLIIVDEDAYVHYVEGCTAPIYKSDSLHSAVVEIIVKKGARCRYTTIQNWSNNVYNLVTKRAVAYEGATMEWIDGNIGSKVTMKYPAVYLMGEHAKGETLSIAFAGEGQHQDAGSKMVHMAPNTSSNIVSKSVARGGGRTSYRGLVEIGEGADGSKSNVLCDALLVDTISRSDTYPYVDVREDDVSMGHEATVSKVSEDQLFYLMSRGMTEFEAMAMIVRGFVEPIAKELPMEYALELNRLIELQMEGAVG